MPKNARPNKKAEELKGSSKPVKTKTAVQTPKVSYVYRKDAFNKVKIA